MTLTEKINTQLSRLELVSITAAKNLHHIYADYAEILALFSNDSFVTASQFISRLEGEGAEIAQDVYERVDETGEEIGSLSDQKRDKVEAWGTEVFGLFPERSFLFGETYPFLVDDHNKIILKDNLTPIQKVYLILLLASSLKHFPLLQQTLTSEFEEISYFALKEYFPNHAEVKQFGKQSDYTGTAIEKIRHLADDMGVEINEKELSDVSPGNTQEEGLDLVGWIPFADKIPSMVSIFGQCACGKSWESKQNESRRYEEFYNFYKVSPLHALFVPYALGKQDGTFFQSKNINKQTLIFDRKRICDLFGDVSRLNLLGVKEIVDECIEYEEDTV